MESNKNLFVGKRHFFIKDKKGKFYFGGRDDSGEIVLGERKYISSPRFCSDITILDLISKAKKSKAKHFCSKKKLRKRRKSLNDIQEYERTKKKSDSIKSIACHNTSRSIVLTNDGEVYILGRNSSKQLNLNPAFNSKCIAVYSGEFASFFQLENGKLFAIGKMLTIGAHDVVSNDNWDFGYNEKERKEFLKSQQLDPIEIKITEFLKHNESISDIKGGKQHTLLLSSKGNVYSCGHGTALGQGRLETFQLNENWKKPFKFRLISFFFKKRIKIIQINCGLNHSLFLSSSFDVYGCGNNEFGQLGLNHLKSTLINGIPQQINALTGKKIKKIECGLNHSIFLSKSNRIYGCGDDRCNQFGLTNGKIKIIVPTELKFKRKFVDIKSGGYSNYFITKNGQIFSCGDNRFGQCLLGSFLITQKTINEPTLIPNIQIDTVSISEATEATEEEEKEEARGREGKEEKEEGKEAIGGKGKGREKKNDKKNRNKD